MFSPDGITITRTALKLPIPVAVEDMDVGKLSSIIQEAIDLMGEGALLCLEGFPGL